MVFYIARLFVCAYRRLQPPPALAVDPRRPATRAHATTRSSERRGAASTASAAAPTAAAAAASRVVLPMLYGPGEGSFTNTSAAGVPAQIPNLCFVIVDLMIKCDKHLNLVYKIDLHQHLFTGPIRDAFFPTPTATQAPYKRSIL